MKKLFVILAAFVFSFGLLFASFSVSQKTFAASDDVSSKIVQYLDNFICSNNEEAAEKIQDRRPGTVGEKQAALNLHNTILLNSQFSGLNLVEDGSTHLGVQYFQFTSSLTGKAAVSQNLRFVKTSDLSKGKKIVIGTSYDNNPYYNSEAETYHNTISSSGNVATLLYLAEYISGLSDQLLFDVEIVFFGAGRSNYAGAYAYTDTMTKADIDNTILFINLDQITLGQNLYMYMNEIDTEKETYIFNTFKKSGVNFTEFNSVTTLNSNYAGEYTYSHRGLEGNNIAFLDHGITSLNLFSGYFEEVGKRGEYKDTESLIGGNKDNYTFIEYVYGFDNLTKVATCLSGLIVDDGLLYNMTKSDNSNKWLDFWKNEKFPIMFMIIIALVFAVVYVAIYYSCKNKSIKIIKQKGINSLMLEFKNMEKDLDSEKKE